LAFEIRKFKGASFEKLEKILERIIKEYSEMRGPMTLKSKENGEKEMIFPDINEITIADSIKCEFTLEEIKEIVIASYYDIAGDGSPVYDEALINRMDAEEIYKKFDEAMEKNDDFFISSFKAKEKAKEKIILR
jgi:hypothetical protein